MREFSVDFGMIVDAVEGRYVTMVVTSGGLNGVLNTTVSEIIEEAKNEVRVTVGETGESNRGEFWIHNASYCIDGDKVVIRGDGTEVLISLPEELVKTLEDDRSRENTLENAGRYLTTHQIETNVVGYFVQLKSGNGFKIAIA